MAQSTKMKMKMDANRAKLHIPDDVYDFVCTLLYHDVKHDSPTCDLIRAAAMDEVKEKLNHAHQGR